MRYLAFHDWPDWKEPEPTTHHVHVHDMAMIASHDVPCAVCWDRPALFTRDMTPGRFKMSWQPCEPCQEAGWQLVQKPRPWWRRLFS